jgi:hypothetical protein
MVSKTVPDCTGHEMGIAIPSDHVSITGKEFDVEDEFSALMKLNYCEGNPNTYYVFLYFTKPDQSYPEVIKFFDSRGSMFKWLGRLRHAISLNPTDYNLDFIFPDTLGLFSSEEPDFELLENLRELWLWQFFVSNFKVEIDITFEEDFQIKYSGKIKVFVKIFPRSDKIRLDESHSTFEFQLDEYSEHSWKLVNNRGFDIEKNFGLLNQYKLYYPELDEMPI